MEEKSTENILVKVLFKMNTLEKTILNISYHLKGIKVSKESMPLYRETYNEYLNALSYFSQSYGFLKCIYLSQENYSCKNFLINNLLNHTYKKFNIIEKNLKAVDVDDMYLESKKLLEEKIRYIELSLKEVVEDIL